MKQITCRTLLINYEHTLVWKYNKNKEKGRVRADKYIRLKNKNK